MVLVFGLTAMALAAGYLVSAYCDWERKNAPRRKVDENGGDAGLFSLFDGDSDGDGGD